MQFRAKVKVLRKKLTLHLPDKPYDTQGVWQTLTALSENKLIINKKVSVCQTGKLLKQLVFDKKSQFVK